MTEETTQPNQIDEAKRIVAELKAENDRKEKLLKDERDLQAQKILGGQSSGAAQEPVKKEATNKEALAAWRAEMKKPKK